MKRGPQLLVLLLLLAVVAMGAALIVRGRGAPPSPGRGTPPSPSSVVVYAPCGMTGPIGAAAKAFRDAHPDIKLEIVYDNAVILVRKIRSGDRPDVFMSPGELEMRQMVEEGYIAAGAVRDFGTLDLVLFAPRSTRDLNSLEDLKKPHIKNISLADPQYNSVGYYAKKALEHFGLWDSLATKIRPREFPLEAVTLVTNGTVEAGITYLTCPLDTAPEKASKSDVRIIATIPRDAYPPVRCQVGLLRGSEDLPAARTFRDFMLSDQAQQAISANGLLPAKELK